MSSARYIHRCIGALPDNDWYTIHASLSYLMDHSKLLFCCMQVINFALLAIILTFKRFAAIGSTYSMHSILKVVRDKRSMW